ncbi:class I SAM-dependent methyltransferase [Geodermatophilus sp. CPCC 206100]|uniref:class I SAM-dependent methyltransferase n=1 Tax=Geodermatophilus sp. CPCC 206100 TaxID=3020054 RepID=UPI003B007EEC
MTHPRDLVDYVAQYRALPFEPLQAGFRRRRVLAQVRAHAPRRLLEIGCGEAPLFLDLPGVETAVIEPAPAFAANARHLAAGHGATTVVEQHAEDVTLPALGGPFDVVVLSCVLHEVPDPQRLLAAARRFCGAGGVLHVNVPSAHSLHRLLAVAMGLIPDPATESDTQRTMQQRGVYDAAGLERELTEAGFRIRERGSIFVKPFTHAQMQQLVDEGFLTPRLLDGLDALAATLPDLGSELWADAEPVGA